MASAQRRIDLAGARRGLCGHPFFLSRPLPPLLLRPVPPFPFASRFTAEHPGFPMSAAHAELTFRDHPRPADRDGVRALCASTGFFNAEEVDVAVELVDERLAKGLASGYEFLFAQRDGAVVGYSCYGRIPLTRESYDLYYIAVEKSLQGTGLGKRILAETEGAIVRAGGTRVYVDTSNCSQYVPTRAFYERCGYRCEAVLADFYAPGDDRVIYLKRVG